MSKPKPKAGYWRAYRIPTLLAVMSIVGLVGALIGDGMLNLLSWVTLGALVAVIGWHLRR